MIFVSNYRFLFSRFFFSKYSSKFSNFAFDLFTSSRTIIEESFLLSSLSFFLSIFYVSFICKSEKIILLSFSPNPPIQYDLIYLKIFVYIELFSSSSSNQQLNFAERTIRTFRISQNYCAKVFKLFFDFIKLLYNTITYIKFVRIIFARRLFKLYKFEIYFYII